MSDRASWLKPLPAAARFILQGPTESFAKAAVVLGIAIDHAACRATHGERPTHGERAAMLWLGPDERLIIVWGAEPASLARQLEEALAAEPHSLVDVSERQLGFVLDAPFAEDLLNCGCPQDLLLEKFPIDHCSRTLYNKAEIVLWRRGTEEFHIEVWRSFADYLTLWMHEAAQDLVDGATDAARRPR